MSIQVPFVAPEVDLQDFPFMPLQVARLRDSNLAAEEEPEACWYAVLLWAASWHQLPAGSLPDNDTVLMRLVGLGRDKRTWKKHRDGALRGFVLCSDGRLYHPVVAEQANEAWIGKLRQRHRTFCAAVRKHNERNPEKKVVSPSFEEWEALDRPDRVTVTVSHLSRVTEKNVACDIASKRQGQGQGQRDSSEEPDGSSPPVSPPPKNRSRGHRLPKDWQPSPLAGEIVRAVSVWPPGAIERELARFRDWAASASGQVAVKSDWDAAWRNWLRKADDEGRYRRNGNGPANQGRGGSTRDAAQLALDRLHPG